jgi:glycosyltransferase involved in cell wall biosynthesis
MMISVIVPIYNVEIYLSEFLSSITSQTYTQLEIILIDDGSTDRCYSICNEWSKRDDRLRVYHIPNGGVSAARNYGIQLATGEYLAFADPDDILHPDIYRLLHNALIENDSDMVICYEEAFQDSQVPDVHPVETYHISEVTDNISTFNHFLDNFTGYIGWSCNKLYKKTLLAGICFPVDRKYLEDICFNIDVSLNVKKCIWIKEKLYLYRQHSGNSMNTNSARKYIDYSEALIYQLDRAASLGNPVIFSMHFEFILNKLFLLYAQAFCDNQKEAARYILLRYKEIRKKYSDHSPTFQTLIKILIKRYFSKLYINYEKTYA